LSAALSTTVASPLPQPFSHEACSLLGLTKRAHTLRANYCFFACSLSRKITEAFKKFQENAKTEGKSPTGEKNQRTQVLVDLEADNVVVEGEKYLLFANPLDKMKAGRVFDEALERGVTLFVSLIESTQVATTQYNNYWTEARCKNMVSKQGWTFSHEGSHVLEAGISAPESALRPQIIETVIKASRGDETREIRHLHYEGWKDRQPMPNEALFRRLLCRIEELQANLDIPIAINCYGGVGRTGTTAICNYFRRKICHELGKKRALKDIQINIPETILAFRQQREHFLNDATQLANVYSVLGQHANELQMQHGVLVDAAGLTHETASVVLSFASAQSPAPSTTVICPSLNISIQPHIEEAQFRNFNYALSVFDSQDARFQDARFFEPMLEELQQCWHVRCCQSRGLGVPVAAPPALTSVAHSLKCSYLVITNYDVEQVRAMLRVAASKEATLFVSTGMLQEDVDRFSRAWFAELPQEFYQVRAPIKHVIAQKLSEIQMSQHTNAPERCSGTHLFYERNFQDKSLVDDDLIEQLLDRIDVYQAVRRPVPFVVDSCAIMLFHALRQAIRQKLEEGIRLDEVQINVPGMLFELLKHYEHIPLDTAILQSAHNQVMRFYQKLKMQELEQAMKTSVIH